MHGLAVTTVEGIGSTRTKLHPVQERLAKCHGSQCGFCTPGIVMSMYTLLRTDPLPTLKAMEEAFQGNLCRCTGYRPILEGYRSLTREAQCPMGAQCCKNEISIDASQDSDVIVDNETLTKLGPIEEFEPYDPTQEPIFPSELQLEDVYDQTELIFQSDRLTWYRPVTLDKLLQLKSEFPNAKIVTGNTEVGIEMKFKHADYPVIISPTHVPEMNEIQHLVTGLEFGGAVTLSTMEKCMTEAIENNPEYKCRVFAGVVEMLRWFAGHQVRNVAAIAGNIMTASPISDLNPLWMAAGCHLTLLSKESKSRTIVMDKDFFTSYRKTRVQPDEILFSIHVPFTKENEFFYGFKQAHRREDDIAIVNAGMRVVLTAGANTIEEFSVAYGGMAPTTVMATKTMTSLVGATWDETLISRACQLLAEDLPLPYGVPGGSEAYRRTLTTSFFFKFYMAVYNQLQPSPTSNGHPNHVTYHRKPSSGCQVYQEVSKTQEVDDPIGRPLAHLSALQQATGEARYCDDIPQYEDELYMSLVWSASTHAKITRIDATRALQAPGVVDFITYKDVPGCNTTGFDNDEEIFASNIVHCQGEVIGAILADTQTHGQRAARMVTVEYADLTPIITIEEAIAADSFHDPPNIIKHGDVTSAFKDCPHVIEGEVRTGGQEHFYLETQACIVVPKGEAGEMEVISATQSATLCQKLVAKALGIPENRVVCKVKRLGGGFGGKETRSSVITLPAAVAAYKHNRPVRCMLDRDEDMMMTGTRHPFLGRYKVGFNDQGQILALSIVMYSNAGYSRDLSEHVMGKACITVDSGYCIPNVYIEGLVCRTNLPTNTAFRGFGGPQANFICETWMTEVADYLGLPQSQIRTVNLYKEGDVTVTGHTLGDCPLGRCWVEVKRMSNFEARQEEIIKFNSHNKWKKRGLSIIPTKFGSGFTETFFMNQAGALVLVYTDGSVLLTHGGIEMGQGLHTKMLQVASRELQIPIEKIHTTEIGTNTVPNTTSTAASISSDINGMAVLDACRKIRKRLQPYIDANPSGSWEHWVGAAYLDCSVGLSATGFYNPRTFWDPSKEMHPYYTYGAAVSEVEIDCLTGDHTALRTDIVMDVGQSLNPAIDIGQIEGGFMQGYGMFTLEDHQYSPGGTLYTRGPGAYKIPGFTDIPVQFNVALLKGSTNPKAVYSSKAIGEPPLFLSASVFFAIRDAIQAARTSQGCETRFTLDAPATAERIRMACVDQFTQQFPDAVAGSYKPWTAVL